jgi:hypothetical protein
MPRSDLTPDRRAEADRIFAAHQQASEQDLRALAELLAAKADADLSGATEFRNRVRILPIAAEAPEATLAGRNKGGRKLLPRLPALGERSTPGRRVKNSFFQGTRAGRGRFSLPSETPRMRAGMAHLHPGHRKD